MNNEIDFYQIKKYIKDNPENADNLEDLLNWTCDKFNIPENRIDEVWNLCRELQPFLQK